MADLLQTGSEWLAARLKASASQLVTYKRGGDSVVISATLGTSDEEVFDSSGAASMHTKRTDFIVTAEDLILDSMARAVKARAEFDAYIGSMFAPVEDQVEEQ